MSLSGRPKVGGGHKSVPLSLDKESRDVLAKIKSKGNNMSEVVDQYLHVIARQIDPGPSVPVLRRIDGLLRNEVDRASRSGDYARVAAISLIGDKLKPYFDLADLHSKTPNIAIGPQQTPGLTPKVVRDLLSEIPRNLGGRARIWAVEFQGSLKELTKRVPVGAKITGDQQSLLEFIHWYLRANLGDHLGTAFAFTDGGLEDHLKDHIVDARYAFRWKLGTPLELNYPDCWKLVSLVPLATADGVPLQGMILPAVWFLAGRRRFMVTYGKTGPVFHVSSQGLGEISGQGKSKVSKSRAARDET